MGRLLQIFFPLLFLLCMVSCQKKETIWVYDYDVSSQECGEADSNILFMQSYSLNASKSLHYCKIVDDSLYYIVLSLNRDSIFVYNFQSCQVRAISLEHVQDKGNGVAAIYYHNHDSIFLFIDRFYILCNKRVLGLDKKDILLTDGDGMPLNSYDLDAMDGIYNGSLYGAHYPWDQYVEDRMYDGKLLVDGIVKKPFISDSAYVTLNPTILALLDLKSSESRALNVRFPDEIIGKKYGEFPGIWIKKHPKNNTSFLMGFATSPYVYCYDFLQDTLCRIKAKYDLTFACKDSSSMKKDTDYPLASFESLLWLPDSNFYVRRIYFSHYNNHISYKWILEILDSAFNHKGYIVENGKYGKPCVLPDGLFYVFSKDGKPHRIFLHGKREKYELAKLFAENVKDSAEIDSISFDSYLKALSLPDHAVLLVMNMKNPCNSCLEQLFDLYYKYQKAIEKSHLFFVAYDPGRTYMAEQYMNNYKIKKTNHIKSDYSLWPKVKANLIGSDDKTKPYVLVEPVSDGKVRISDPSIGEICQMVENILENS